MPVMAAPLRAVLGDASVGTVAIGHRSVRRFGFGAMRVSQARDLQGQHDRSLALELVLGARDRGVQFFDTANIYGLGANEEILAPALAPYPQDVIVATKAGFRPGTWHRDSGPSRRWGVPSTSARSASAACGGCASTVSTFTRCTSPTLRFRGRKPSAPSPSCSGRGRCAWSGCRT